MQSFSLHSQLETNECEKNLLEHGNVFHLAWGNTNFGL